MRVLILVITLLGVLVLNAHPASEVKAVFEKNSSILKVDFTHKVKDEAEHFIFNIEVNLNGKKAVKQELWRQDSKEGGSVIYKIVDAKIGDKIQISTECNKGGKKSETISIK